jgi:hypothetical protein
MTTRNRLASSRRTLQMETLEDRKVMTTTVGLSGGVLTLNDDNISHLLRISQSGSTITVAGAALPYSTSQVQKVVVNAAGGNDVVDVSSLQIPAVIYGGDGNDTVYCGHASDYVDAGAGNDLVYGGDGNDALHGGDGDDRLFGNGGYDYLYGDNGIDFMDDCSRTAHEFYALQNDGSPDYIADMIAPASGFSPEQIRQGWQNYTCHFLATLGSLAKAGVNFNNYITYQGFDSNGVGVYNVQLYNGSQWVNIRVSFEGHTNGADAQATVDFSSWATIMSRAYNAYFGNQGGDPENDFMRLGRSPASTTTMNDNTYNAINYYASRGYGVVASTGNSVASGDLVTNHSYMIMGTQTYNGVRYVLVRNPWGFDGPNNFNSDGYVWVDWNTFGRSFVKLTVG